MAHILIADDDPTIADLLARILTRCGHTTAMVGDGLATLSCLEQRPFNLLISDLEMPRFGGAALLRVFAARPLRPRILVVSAGAIDPQTRMLADGFLAKPFGAWEVAAAVAGLLAPGAPTPALATAAFASSPS